MNIDNWITYYSMFSMDELKWELKYLGDIKSKEINIRKRAIRICLIN